MVDNIRLFNGALEVGFSRGSRWFAVCSDEEMGSVSGVRFAFPVRLEDGVGGYLVVCDRIRGFVRFDSGFRFVSHVGAIEFVTDGSDVIHRVYDVLGGSWLGIRYRRSIGVVAYRTVSVIGLGSDVERRIRGFIRPMVLGVGSIPCIGLWVDGGELYMEDVDVLPLDLALAEAERRGERAIYAVHGAQWVKSAYDIGSWLRSGGATLMVGYGDVVCLELVGEGSVVWVNGERRLNDATAE